MQRKIQISQVVMNSRIDNPFHLKSALPISIKKPPLKSRSAIAIRRKKNLLRAKYWSSPITRFRAYRALDIMPNYRRKVKEIQQKVKSLKHTVNSLKNVIKSIPKMRHLPNFSDSQLNSKKYVRSLKREVQSLKREVSSLNRKHKVIEKQSHRRVFFPRKLAFWTTRYKRRAISWKPLDINLNLFIPTVRNSAFDLQTTLKFHHLVEWMDLPIHFNIAPHHGKVLRYRATFYGVQYNENLFSYNLWLTMGLKRNIAVPWGLYYHTPWVRKNYLARIYKNSWGSYAFAVKNSFRKITNLPVLYMSDNFYLKSDFSMHLSDRCIWNLRRKFSFHRAACIYEDELDFNISTYHAGNDYYDFRARSIMFWTADSAYFRDPTFYITSYDPTLLLSPRKHLRRKWRMNAIVKFHRSWRLFKYFFNTELLNIRHTQACILLTQFVSSLKYSFLNKLQIQMSRALNFNKDKNLNLLMFKYISLLKQHKYVVLNITRNLQKFFKWFFILFSPIRFSKSCFFFNQSDDINKKLKPLTRIALIKQFYKLRMDLSSDAVNVGLQHKWMLLCHNFSLAFKNWYKRCIGRLTLNDHRFVWVNTYFRSHGYFKFRITRWKEVRRDKQRLRSVGLEHSLRCRKGASVFLRRNYDFLCSGYKRLKPWYSLSSTILNFSQLFFQVYFMCLKKNLTLNFNFLQSELIEGYTFQLYFMLHILLKLKFIFFNKSSKKRVTCVGSWTGTGSALSRWRFKYMKKLVTFSSNFSWKSKVAQKYLKISEPSLRKFIGSNP